MYPDPIGLVERFDAKPCSNISISLALHKSYFGYKLNYTSSRITSSKCTKIKWKVKHSSKGFILTQTELIRWKGEGVRGKSMIKIITAFDWIHLFYFFIWLFMMMTSIYRCLTMSMDVNLLAIQSKCTDMQQICWTCHHYMIFFTILILSSCSLSHRYDYDVNL